MTLSLPNFSRLGALVMALAYTSITFGVLTAPAPAIAMSKGPYYVAELAAPASESRTVAGGVAWYCEGTTCRAAKGTSRPLRICRGLQREFGEVKSFETKGEALAENRLAKCNGN